MGDSTFGAGDTSSYETSELASFIAARGGQYAGPISLRELGTLLAGVYDAGKFARGLRAPVANLMGPPVQLENPIRYMELLGQDEANFPGASVPLRLDVPAILWPQNRLATLKTPSVDNIVCALPSTCIDPTSGSFLPEGITPAHVSINGGALYLPAGEWFLYYPEVPLNKKLHCLVFDVPDPLLAAQILQIPGNHSTSGHTTDITVTGVGVTPTIIWQGRANRKAIFVQCTHPTVGLRIGFAPSDTSPAAPTASRGIYLPPLQYPPLVFAGSALILETLYGYASDPAGSTCAIVELI